MNLEKPITLAAAMKAMRYSKEEYIREFRLNNKRLLYGDGQTVYAYDLFVLAIRAKNDEIVVYNTDQETNVELGIRYYDFVDCYHFEIEDLLIDRLYTNENVKQFVLFAERKDMLSVFIYNKPLFDLYGIYHKNYFDLEFQMPAVEAYMAAALFDSTGKIYSLLQKLRLDKYYALKDQERRSDLNEQ